MEKPEMADETSGTDLLELATELTIAWLANPNTRASAEEVPSFLQSMHGAVSSLASPQMSAEVAAPTAEYMPAVTARKSLASKDHIISLIDGKPYKTLKRNLSGHGLTPPQYRERYGLKSDYPMAAPSYAETRRSLAKKIGLGRKPGTKMATKPAAKAPVKPKAPRAKAAAPEAAPSILIDCTHAAAVQDLCRHKQGPKSSPPLRAARGRGGNWILRTAVRRVFRPVETIQSRSVPAIQRRYISDPQTTVHAFAERNDEKGPDVPRANRQCACDLSVGTRGRP
jgi:predicted transcriptional regulator